MLNIDKFLEESFPLEIYNCVTVKINPSYVGEGISLDINNSCVIIKVGLQTINKKHRRFNIDNNSLAYTK